MMIKIAVVLCAVMATSMVCANDFEEEALGDLLDLLISEEVSSPDDVALQSWSWWRKTFHKAKNAVHNAAGHVSGACKSLGHSPEEARAMVLEAIPEIKETELEEKFDAGRWCQVAHGVAGRR